MFGTGLMEDVGGSAAIPAFPPKGKAFHVEVKVSVMRLSVRNVGRIGVPQLQSVTENNTLLSK